MKKDKSLNNLIKKHTVIAILSLVAVISTISLVSYSLFTTSHKNTRDQVIDIGDFDVTLSSSTGQIILSDLYPNSDEDLEGLTAYSFTITNTGDYNISYNTYFVDATSAFLNTGNNATTYSKYTQINSSEYQYIKYKFNSNAVNTLGNIYNSTTGHMNLSSGTLAPQGTVTNTIYFWEAQTSPNSMIGKIVSLDLHVDATATS